MQSASVLDRHASLPYEPEVRDLLVLWQHPETREIVPIGRFMYDGATYSFAYTRAASRVEDLRPLAGLEDLHHRYTSSHIPAVFGQRVMEADRPDYADYLRTLGLDPSHATPWEQIVQSGGSRAGDTLQFMQVPTVIEGHARARFLANGVRHVPEEARRVSGRTVTVTPEQHEAALQSLRPGTTVLVESEEGNPHDPCAALVTSDGVPLGWVPRAMSASIRELMTVGPIYPTVVRVGEPGTPPHLRLVLDLNVPVSGDFEFDREGLWTPIDGQ